MYRFYFHFRQGVELVPDHEGIELADSDAAYMEAYKGAQEMWGGLLQKQQDPRRCAFEVHDAHGAMIVRLPFGELLESCRDSNSQAFLPSMQSAFAHVARTKQVSAEFRNELEEVRRNLREASRLLAQKV